jgi:hypothetical protein
MKIKNAFVTTVISCCIAMTAGIGQVNATLIASVNADSDTNLDVSWVWDGVTSSSQPDLVYWDVTLSAGSGSGYDFAFTTVSPVGSTYSFNGALAALTTANTFSTSFKDSIGSIDYLFTGSGRTDGGWDLQLTAMAAPVPEPGELALMLSGLGLMGYMARRRQNRAAV